MSEDLKAPGGGRIDESLAFHPLHIAVMTVSDTRTTGQ